MSSNIKTGAKRSKKIRYKSSKKQETENEKHIRVA